MQAEEAKEDIKPSRACGGEVSRTATAVAPTRQAAEDDALDAAQKAAKRACEKKQCGSANGSCAYVEASSTGSSGPVNAGDPASFFTATMTTTGKCSCER